MRRVFSQRVQGFALAGLLAGSMIAPTFAGADRKGDAVRGNASVSIENFGRVNDHIYRGAQPKGDEFRQLAAIGIKTIVDLRGDSNSGSRAAATAAGLRYINLPLASKQYPRPDAADKFLEIVNNEANWPVYVHCQGGRHRTGAMIAVYRMAMDGWNVDRAYQEMKKYDFYTSWGHGCYKDYVFDYYRNLLARNRMPGNAPKAAAGGGQGL
jgi:protein tyrosine/serine phosphatase